MTETQDLQNIVASEKRNFKISLLNHLQKAYGFERSKASINITFEFKNKRTYKFSLYKITPKALVDFIDAFPKYLDTIPSAASPHMYKLRRSMHDNYFKATTDLIKLILERKILNLAIITNVDVLFPGLVVINNNIELIFVDKLLESKINEFTKSPPRIYYTANNEYHDVTYLTLPYITFEKLDLF